MIRPHPSAECLQILLDRMASMHPNERIALVLEGAGWHQTESLLTTEPNFRLLKLPLCLFEIHQRIGTGITSQPVFARRTFSGLMTTSSALQPPVPTGSISIGSGLNSGSALSLGHCCSAALIDWSIGKSVNYEFH